MAAHLGVHRNTVSRYLNGHITPKISVLRDWAQRTNVPVEWLLTGTLYPPPDGGGSSSRSVAWGDALVASSFKYPGGLKHAMDTIRASVGLGVGSRAAFLKLFHATDPAALDADDAFRAWLLIATFGDDPNEWGITDAAVPAGHDPVTLRVALRARRDSNSQPSDPKSDDSPFRYAAAA